MCNFSNFVTSITALSKDTIPKNSSSLWDFWIRVKSVRQTPILLSMFFAYNFSHATFVRVSHCFDFFLNYFLAIFNELVITLKFIYLALITFDLFFLSFVIALVTFGHDLALENIIWCVFLMWSFKRNLNLNGLYGHFFAFIRQRKGNWSLTHWIQSCFCMTSPKLASNFAIPSPLCVSFAIITHFHTKMK